MYQKSDYIILVDMDDTIEDLLHSWIACLNNNYGYHVKPEDVTEWDVGKFFPDLSKEALFKPLVSEELWKNIKPIDGAVEYLRRLVEEGFTVRICTASSPTSYALKMTHFVKKYLPFLDTRLHCICIHEKQMVKANVLFDDHYENLLGGSYEGVLFTRVHNADRKVAPGIVRVDTWAEFYDWVQKDFEKVKNKKK